MDEDGLRLLLADYMDATGLTKDQLEWVTSLRAKCKIDQFTTIDGRLFGVPVRTDNRIKSGSILLMERK